MTKREQEIHDQAKKIAFGPFTLCEERRLQQAVAVGIQPGHARLQLRLHRIFLAVQFVHRTK